MANDVEGREGVEHERFGRTPASRRCTRDTVIPNDCVDLKQTRAAAYNLDVADAQTECLGILHRFSNPVFAPPDDCAQLVQSK